MKYWTIRTATAKQIPGNTETDLSEDSDLFGVSGIFSLI